MNAVVSTLSEVVSSVNSPYQILAIFVISIAAVGLALVKRQGFIQALGLARARGPRTTLLVLILSVPFFVVLLLFVLSFFLADIWKTDLIRSYRDLDHGASKRSSNSKLSDEEIKELAAKAKASFKARNYEGSAELFKTLAEAFGADATEHREYQGLVTASLFGAGHHYDGLLYLCSIYQGRHISDHRYRHEAHAHIRTYAFKNGFPETLHMLETLRIRPGCDRDDFTPVFAAIPLELMRAMKKGYTMVGMNETHVRPEDKKFLRQLIATGDIPFIDHAHFVLEEYDVTLENFPLSYIRNLAHLAKAELAGGREQTRLLERFIQSYPGVRTRYVVGLLIQNHTLDGNTDKAAQYLHTYALQFAEDKDFDSNFHLRLRFREKCEQIAQAFSMGNFRRLLSIYTDAHTSFLAAYGKDYTVSTSIPSLNWRQDNCFGEKKIKIIQIQNIIEIATTLLGAQNSSDELTLLKEAIILKLCGDWRDGKISKSTQNSKCSNINAAIPDHVSLHQAAARLLIEVSAMSSSNEITSRALFLAGLSFQRARDYGSYERTMKEYVIKFPDGPFADDAYAELGWYYKYVIGDFDSAEKMWRHVETTYPTRNAFDNALNWLIVLYRDQGRYIQALDYSFRLLANMTSERLSGFVYGRHSTLLDLNSTTYSPNNPKIHLIATSGEILAWKIAADANEFQMLRGKRILKIDGIPADNLGKVFERLKKRKVEGQEMVTLEVSDRKTYGRRSLRVPVSHFGY